MTQHYYPEGGWGWVVVGVASIIHALNHGLHMAFGALLPLAMNRFSQHATALGRFSLPSGHKGVGY